MMSNNKPFQPPPGSRLPGYKPAPGSRYAQTDKELLHLENYMVSLVNKERRLLGLHELIKDPLLAAVSRAHSSEMRYLNYFSHESPTPALKTISDRYFLAYGLKPRYIAENISYATLRAWFGRDDPMENLLRHHLKKPLIPTTKDMDAAHDGLMHSPGHRDNILSIEPTFIGIGLISEKGQMWITQMFSHPFEKRPEKS